MIYDTLITNEKTILMLKHDHKNKNISAFLNLELDNIFSNIKQKSKSPLTTLLRVSAEASSDVVNILWI